MYVSVRACVRACVRARARARARMCVCVLIVTCNPFLLNEQTFIKELLPPKRTGICNTQKRRLRTTLIRQKLSVDELAIASTGHC